MFTIRPTQVQVLAEPLLAKFAEEMRAHCARFFPGPTAELGEQGLDTVIRHGMGRAWSYGFERHRTVQAYVDLMFLLGSDFDRDPQLPWAQRILTDPEVPTAGQRSGVLWGEAMHYIDTVAGPNGGLYFRALIRARSLDPASMAAVDPAHLENEAGRRLGALFPEKYDRLDEESRRAMLRLGTDKGAEHGLVGGPGRLLLLAMMLLLGSHFDRDPQFPWARAILDREDREAVKVERLRREATAQIDRALAVRPATEDE